MGRLTKSLRVILGILVLLGLLLGAAFFLGVFQQPSAGVADIGDWGEVSDERTEIITSLWVYNPNQLGISFDNNVRASYQLSLNGVNLAEGTKEGIRVQSGNNTVEVTTEVRNQRLPEWWVAFIQNNETIPVRADPSVNLQAGPITASPPIAAHQETLLTDSTPVSSALSQVASNAEGQYTKSIARQTAGYEIRRGWATWGEVNQDHTVVYFHFIVHNPSRTVPVPAEPEQLGVTVEMNDVEMFRAQGDETSLQNPNDFSMGEAIDKRVLGPGETKEVVYAVQMDNEKIDEWFVSHVRRGERTTIRVEFQLLFSARGTTFRIPEESQIAYTCELQTGILVDDQETQTTCASPESVPGVDTSETPTGDDNGGSTDRPSTDETETPQPSTETSVSTPTQTEASPTARAEVDPTQGEAPLTVQFDASRSTDPNNDIVEYVWRFKDGTPPARGETVSHTFRTAGEYQVELVVIDSQGNRDSTTVTVTVESRVG